MAGLDWSSLSMNDVSGLREQLLARRAEIDLALEQLDYIESLAAGRDVSGALASSLAINGGDVSIAQSVHDELVGKRLTAEQLARNLGLSVKQVKYALTGHRLRRVVKSLKSAGTTRYTIQITERADGCAAPSLSEAIVDLLAEDAGRMWRAQEVARELNGKVRSSAKAFPATVSSTLSNLARSGKIEKVRGGYAARTGGGD